MVRLTKNKSTALKNRSKQHLQVGILLRVFKLSLFILNELSASWNCLHALKVQPKFIAFKHTLPASQAESPVVFSDVSNAEGSRLRNKQAVTCGCLISRLNSQTENRLCNSWKLAMLPVFSQFLSANFFTSHFLTLFTLNNLHRRLDNGCSQLHF